MFYTDSQGNRYYIGKAFFYDNTHYGINNATHSTFTELGFTQVLVDPRPDSAYYMVSGPDNEGKYTSTPRDMDVLKQLQIKQEKETAKLLLQPTDWMVIRAMDVGVAVAAVPADVSNHRSSIRGVCDTRCNAIGSTVTVDQLESLVKAPAQLYDRETEEYYTNPDPHLSPWPLPLEV